METDKNCRECGKQFESYESILRHLRVHHIKAKDYVLKWKYDNVIPLCRCGCGQNTAWNISMKDFTKFVHGHHATGRKKTDEEKAKIGKKNSENMKRWMSEHPDVAKERIVKMREKLNCDSYRKVSQSIRRFWDTSPKATILREKATNRAIKLLESGVIGPHAPYKCEWKYNPFTKKEEFMHSSMEAQFLDACITKQYSVTKEHGICISYTHPNGKIHTYVPDFF